jgi:hypothetical protein
MVVGGYAHHALSGVPGGGASMNLPMVNVCGVSVSRKVVQRESRVGASQLLEWKSAHTSSLSIPLKMQAPQPANPANKWNWHTMPQLADGEGACVSRPICNRREPSSDATDREAMILFAFTDAPYPRSKTFVNVQTCDHPGQRRLGCGIKPQSAAGDQ